MAEADAGSAPARLFLLVRGLRDHRSVTGHHAQCPGVHRGVGLLTAAEQTSGAGVQP